MTADVFAVQAVQRPMLHVRWVRAQIVAGLTNTEIRQHLLQDDLPCPDDVELDGIRLTWTPPSNFTPRSMSHAASIAFLCDAQVFPLFHERAAHGALDVLRQARVRELVEAAAICAVPADVVVRMVKSLLRYETDERALRLFRSAFFDVGCVSRTQLRVLVQERVQLSVARAAGMRADDATMQRAIQNDARMTAVSLASSSLAWRAILLSLGHLPPKAELGHLIDELEGVAEARAAQALLRGGRDDERRADAFVGVLGKLRNIRESIAAPQETLAQALSRVRIQQDVAPPVTVGELVARGDQVGMLEAAPRVAEDEVDVEEVPSAKLAR